MATKIAYTWIQWDLLRQVWKDSKEEVRRYVYATDTTQTSNSQLPWKNKTTLPKLCHIRDNLYSNYTATLWPQRKWLVWEANEYDPNSVAKRNSIVNYMAWAIKRINPLDIVMNPTTESFGNSPKIIRSIISKGELKKMLASMTTDENRDEIEGLYNYLKEIRNNAWNYSGDWKQNDALYAMDGFTSFRVYLTSNFVEVLTFYGDLYDDVNDVLYENHMIVVVDRHKIIVNKPNTSFFGTPPIYHSPWRKRQDNLWGMGPLDNLVGMQYRLDHIENMRADIIDLTTYPVQMITGFVEDYLWQPGAKIFAGDEGKVELIQPDVNVLQANFDLQRYEATMEEMAGAPKEAMGFRTPGEKTKYEVQRLENAASRVFQNKIKQFEEQIVEPLLNAMLELARRNLTGATTIKVFDDELKVQTFQTLTVEDITGVGRIRPLAARHFAEQANLVQNLTNLAGSGLWPLVQMHFSGIKLSKAFEDIFDMCDYEFIMPYIGLAEQADAQKMAQALEEQVVMNAQTATGRNGDYDMNLPNYSAAMQPPQPQPGQPGPGGSEAQTSPQMGGAQGQPNAVPGQPAVIKQPFDLKRQPPANAEPGGMLGTQ
jgi:hypothetical protein